MKHAIHLEHRASSSQSKHEGEPSFGLCDRLDRTRDNSRRQLPTDHDYAVTTREYQTDQSSLKSAQAAARSVFGKQQKQRRKQPHCCAELTGSLRIRPMRSSRSHWLLFRVDGWQFGSNPAVNRLRSALESRGIDWRQGYSDAIQENQCGSDRRCR